MRLTAATLLLISLTAFAAAPPAGWTGLIERLGSEDPTVRKAAEKALMGLGEDALSPLRRAGRSNADPDLRLRAFALAAAIEDRLDREVLVFRGHTDGVLGLAVSPDGRRLASGGWQAGTEHVGRVWDVSTGKELLQLTGHTAAVGGIAWTPDGRRIVTGSNDGHLMVWEVATGKTLKRFSGTTSAMRSIALVAEGSKVVTCGFEPVARVWDVEAQSQLGAGGGAGMVRWVAVLPGGKHFAAAGTDGGIRVIDVQTCKVVRTMGSAHAAGDLFTGGARGVACSADGKRLASCGADGLVKMHDTATGKLVWESRGHAGGVQGVAFSPDGQRLLSGGEDREAAVWDVGTGKVVQRFQGHADAVTAVAFLPGGRRAVTGSADRTIRLWNVRK